MKNIYILISFFITISGFAQKTIEKEFILSNGKKKNVKIFIPKEYDTDTISKYPVMVVLNDQYLFDITKGNSKLYSKIDLAPKQIVVGIPTNEDENEDVSVINQNLALTDNAKSFYNFIKKDLLSYIKGKYKTSPFVSIIGQGKAANFLLYFLGENQSLFNSYIAINPALDQRAIAKIQSYNLKRFDQSDNTYFLYMSGNPYQAKEVQEGFKNFEEQVSNAKTKNFKYEFDDFKDTPNSLSSISEGIPRAFSFIFKLFRNISKQEFDNNIKDLAPLAAIEYLEKKYIDIDYLYGANTNVRLEDFYAIEEIVADQQGGDYLRVLGEFAMLKHPESPLGDYYIGRFHEIGENYERALEYYKFGYGKMNPAEPEADQFYKNIDRVKGLVQPKEENNDQEEDQEQE